MLLSGALPSIEEKNDKKTYKPKTTEQIGCMSNKVKVYLPEGLQSFTLPRIGRTDLEGARGVGKDAMGRILTKLGYKNPLFSTSQLIRRFIAEYPDTPEAMTLEEKIADGAVARGELLPARQTVTAVATMLQKECYENEFRHIFLSGGCRTGAEIEEWEKLGILPQVFHILGSEQESFDGVAMRQSLGGEEREDEGAESVKNARRIYDNVTVPGLHDYNRRHPGYVFEIQRSEEPKTKIIRFIDHLRVSNNLKKKWKNNLKTISHPAALELKKLEGDIEMQNRAAHSTGTPAAVPRFNTTTRTTAHSAQVSA